MAFPSGAVTGALVLFMVACMVTSGMSMSSSVLETLSEVEQAAVKFLPCFEALKGIESCPEEILKAVFGLPLDTLCCQVVYQIAENCVPKGFPLSGVFLPVAIEKCIPCTPSEGMNCMDLKS